MVPVSSLQVTFNKNPNAMASWGKSFSFPVARLILSANDDPWTTSLLCCLRFVVLGYHCS